MTLDPLLAEIQSAALTLDWRQPHSDAARSEAVRRISLAFQAIHNMASLVGFEEVAAFSGHIEDLMAQTRAGLVPITDPLPGLIVAAADQVRLLLRAAQGGARVDVSLQAALLETAFQMSEPTLPVSKARDLGEEASIQDAIFLPPAETVSAR